MYSTNTSTLETVRAKQELCDLLDENVIIPFAKLQEDSQFPETLEVTEARQYRERGLLHISDEAYLLFVCLEEKWVRLLNMHRFRKKKQDMVQNVLNLSKDEDVLAYWKKCFSTADFTRSIVCDLFMFS